MIILIPHLRRRLCTTMWDLRNSTKLIDFSFNRSAYADLIPFFEKIILHMKSLTACRILWSSVLLWRLRGGEPIRSHRQVFSLNKVLQIFGHIPPNCQRDYILCCTLLAVFSARTKICEVFPLRFGHQIFFAEEDSNCCTRQVSKQWWLKSSGNANSLF